MSGAAEWSQEATEELRRLWCVEGRPITAIAKTVGRSHWSIRGKIRYERWPAPGGNRKSALTRETAARLNSIRQSGPLSTLPPDRRILRGSAWEALPGHVPVPLVDLESGMCKWPIGEGRPYLFCGADSGLDHYCSHHTAISRRQPAVSK